MKEVGLGEVVTIYTDGSALGNGKKDACCGAGVVLIFGETVKELSIPLPNYTTNNQAELYASIAGLDALKRPCKVILYTDSSYVQQGITTWMRGWKRRNWMTANKGAVKNKDLWQQLDLLVQQHDVEFRWVKGHNGDKWNSKADELAVAASYSLKEGK